MPAKSNGARDTPSDAVAAAARTARRAAALGLGIGVLARVGSAQAGQGPPPSPPFVSRDAAGSVTLRAVRLAEPLSVDGRLDESLYREVQPISDFVPIEPQRGAGGHRTDRRVDCLRRRQRVRDVPLLRKRPPSNRKYSWTGGVTLIENGAGRLESREQSAAFGIDFQNAHRFSVEYGRFYELLTAPFRIASGVTLPAGPYGFGSVRVGFNRAALNRVAGNMYAEHGTFYNGHKTTLGVTSGRVNPAVGISVEPTYSINRLNLIEGAFTTHLAGARATWTATPLMFTSALVQYNSGTHSLSANVRRRWEYRPGSELFIVYNEERDTLTRRFPKLSQRAFIIKINRLMRF